MGLGSIKDKEDPLYSGSSLWAPICSVSSFPTPTIGMKWACACDTECFGGGIGNLT